MRLFSSSSSSSSSSFEDDTDLEDEDDPPPEDQFLAKLEPPSFRDFDIKYLQQMKEEGDLLLQPFYQRGYKWSQNQASAWIESILRGYPCLPEITLLRTIDENGDLKFAVFDGQQRLTSVMNYISNRRGSNWPERKSDDSFRLENLSRMKQYTGKTFKDLPREQQNEIRKFGIRCAVIPASWSMADYIDFFQRIQGGGTPMTDHELRRALSQGHFTALLDDLASDELVLRALNGCSVVQKADSVQQLLLRYYQYRYQDDTRRFGRPSFNQHGLETMKFLNKEMKSWTEEEFYKQADLVRPLKKSIELILAVFKDKEPFRQPAPLIKDGKPLEDVKKVWLNEKNIRNQLWDCTLATFAKDDVMKQEKAIRKNAGDIRDALISLMQTNPVFTDTLRSADIDKRIRLFVTEIFKIIDSSEETDGGRKVSPQQRRDLIRSARESGSTCTLCGQLLGPFDDHLHIDHIHPISKGGTNAPDNLQVVHKTCNLVKSNKISSLS